VVRSVSKVPPKFKVVFLDQLAAKKRGPVLETLLRVGGPIQRPYIPEDPTLVIARNGEPVAAVNFSRHGQHVRAFYSFGPQPKFVETHGITPAMELALQIIRLTGTRQVRSVAFKSSGKTFARRLVGYLRANHFAVFEKNPTAASFVSAGEDAGFSLSPELVEKIKPKLEAPDRKFFRRKWPKFM